MAALSDELMTRFESLGLGRPVSFAMTPGNLLGYRRQVPTTVTEVWHLGSGRVVCANHIQRRVLYDTPDGPLLVPFILHDN